MRLRTQRGVKREGGNRVFNGYASVSSHSLD